MPDFQDTLATMLGALPHMQQTQAATQETALKAQRALVDAVLLLHEDLQQLIAVLKRNTT